MHSKPQKKWTQKDVDLCLSLRAAGQTVKQIADFMERSYYSVDGYFRRDTIERARQNRIRNENRRYRPYIVDKVIIPAFVIADRDRRADERSEMSEAQLLMGEPTPSQSALARPPRGGQSNAEKA